MGNIKEYIEKTKSDYEQASKDFKNSKVQITGIKRGTLYNKLCSSLNIETKSLKDKDSKVSAIKNAIENETDEKRKEEISNELVKIEVSEDKKIYDEKKRSKNIYDSIKKRLRFNLYVAKEELEKNSQNLDKDIETKKIEIEKAKEEAEKSSKKQKGKAKSKIVVLQDELKELEEKKVSLLADIDEFNKETEELKKFFTESMKFFTENGIIDIEEIKEGNIKNPEEKKDERKKEGKGNNQREKKSGSQQEERKGGNKQEERKSENKQEERKDGNKQEERKSENKQEERKSENKQEERKSGNQQEERKSDKDKESQTKSEQGNSQQTPEIKNKSTVPIVIDLNQENEKIVKQYITMSREERAEIMKDNKIFSVISTALSSSKVLLTPGYVDKLQDITRYDSKDITAKINQNDIQESVMEIFDAVDMNLPSEMYEKMFNTSLKNRIFSKGEEGQSKYMPNIVYNFGALKKDNIELLNDVISSFYCKINSGKIKDEKLIENFKNYIDMPVKQGVINSMSSQYFKKFSFRFLNNMFNPKYKVIANLRSTYSYADELKNSPKNNFEEEIRRNVNSEQEASEQEQFRTREEQKRNQNHKEHSSDQELN